MQTCLLDKNVVRRAIEGIGKARLGQPFTTVERASLRLLLAVEQRHIALFISIEMRHILDRYGNQPDVRLFMNFVEILRPARYFKHWARRLRERDFSREDAKVLALATFGTNAAANRLGVEGVATFDQPFINNFVMLHDVLAERLQAMTTNLSVPYDSTKLPTLISPVELLATLH